MEDKLKATKLIAGVVATGSTIIVGKVCKHAYRAYKRKCFELQLASGIIDVQRDLIEDLLEENKKLKKKTKTESK